MQQARTAQLTLPLVLADQPPPLPEDVRAEVRRLLVLMVLQMAKSPMCKEGPENEREDPADAS